MSNDGQDAQDEQNDSLTRPGSQGDESGRGGSDEVANNPGKQDGDEPASAAQKSYISRMAADVGEEVPYEMTKAEAEDRIRELEIKTGRDATPELA